MSTTEEIILIGVCRLRNLMIREMENHFREYGLTSAQFSVLEVLYAKGDFVLVAKPLGNKLLFSVMCAFLKIPAEIWKINDKFVNRMLYMIVQNDPSFKTVRIILRPEIDDGTFLRLAFRTLLQQHPRRLLQSPRRRPGSAETAGCRCL